MSGLSDLLDIDVVNDDGWPQVLCRLDPSDLELAAANLAEGIAGRRLNLKGRFYQQWQARRLERTDEPPTESDLEVLTASLLENLGTPNEPGPENHLHGLVAEAIWWDVVADVDAGLGLPLRIDGHDYSVTDPGGDGLTVYATAGEFYFRLWESKYHGANAPVKDTVSGACRQVKSRSTSYLARFSRINQQITDNKPLARFYASLTELWVNQDPAAGVGISVGAGSDANAEACFGNMTTYFDLEATQHQAHLHLMGDFPELARQVRFQVWKGCGLWTERSISRR